MSVLARVCDAVQSFQREVEAQVRRARTDAKAATVLRRKRLSFPTLGGPTRSR